MRVHTKFWGVYILAVNIKPHFISMNLNPGQTILLEKQIARKFLTLFLFTGVEQTAQEFVLNDWAAVTGCLFPAKILALWLFFHCLGILLHSTRF